MYGSGSSPVTLPGPGVVTSWFIRGDLFTETLTDVSTIDRTVTNQINLTLSGTVTDSIGVFSGTPATMTLGAIEGIDTFAEAGGAGAAIRVSLSNFATTGAVPEPSIWVMMGLGFVGLGSAAVRRRSEDRSALAI